MKLFAKIVNCIQPFAVFGKHFIIGVSQGYKNVSNKTKQKLGALSLISQKIRTAISANFFYFYSTLFSRYYLEVRHYLATVCYTKQAVPKFHSNDKFPHKTTYFLNNSHDVYKNADGNSKFYITKLNP